MNYHATVYEFISFILQNNSVTLHYGFDNYKSSYLSIIRGLGPFFPYSYWTIYSNAYAYVLRKKNFLMGKIDNSMVEDRFTIILVNFTNHFFVS